MLGLTNLGIVHTVFSLVAVFTGAGALIVHREIVMTSRLGKVYIGTTVVTCLTGFGIFQHGGFGVPHALGIITLLVLGIAEAARRGAAGKASIYVSTAAMTSTYFFHWIPGIVETTTRLPLSNPLVSSREAPELQMFVGVAFAIYLLGVSLQLWGIWRKGRVTMTATARA